MRSSVLLLAASSCTHAAWLRWSNNRELEWSPQETSNVADSSQVGWTPKPTPAPGVKSDIEVVVDLLMRRQETTNWTNSETCGWFSGISSSAVVCGNGFSCATNDDHIVACASGTIEPFYSVCLDYSAVQNGDCDNPGPNTGCCQQATEPACGTYIWTGSPQRSMYKCFESSSAVSILDVPQFVVDASIFSKTHTTPSPTLTATPSPSDPGVASSPTTAVPGSGNPTDSSTSSSTPSPGSSTNSTTNTGAIAGGAVGGFLALLALLLAYLLVRRKLNKAKAKANLGFSRNKKSHKEDNSTNHYDVKVMGGRKSRDAGSYGYGDDYGRPRSRERSTCLGLTLWKKKEKMTKEVEADRQGQRMDSLRGGEGDRGGREMDQWSTPSAGVAAPPPMVSVSYTVREGATKTKTTNNHSHSRRSSRYSRTASPPALVIQDQRQLPTRGGSRKRQTQTQTPNQQGYGGDETVSSMSDRDSRDYGSSTVATVGVGRQDSRAKELGLDHNYGHPALAPTRAGQEASHAMGGAVQSGGAYNSAEAKKARAVELDSTPIEEPSSPEWSGGPSYRQSM
ncbi:Uu.00g083140.m01.CDS01 [Anthostomella pinea]|uniref:Uu.00g083140.m01.CDS01 n=1 Tax=Anthostomella pinea TaxID=933095 RepID=A0AAI8YJQ1_9PEZI|nr:Uu.00g083140.m01.CDS01 [Anthostomella pinea]